MFAHKIHYGVVLDGLHCVTRSAFNIVIMGLMAASD